MMQMTKIELRTWPNLRLLYAVFDIPGCYWYFTWNL